jgi:hypothetical protein
VQSVGSSGAALSAIPDYIAAAVSPPRAVSRSASRLRQLRRSSV